MRPELMPPDLTSPQQALDIGYDEGSHHRSLGAQNHLNDAREMFFENVYEDRRSRRNLFYELWRRGFDAGYLGHIKPAL